MCELLRKDKQASDEKGTVRRHIAVHTPDLGGRRWREAHAEHKASMRLQIKHSSVAPAHLLRSCVSRLLSSTSRCMATRHAPPINAVHTTKAAGAEALSPLISLEEMVFDNSFVRELPGDPERGNSNRQVVGR